MRVNSVQNQNSQMGEDLKESEKLPDYLNWYLKSRGLTLAMIKKSVEQTRPIDESPDVLIRQEFEQTRKLLVGLFDELFKKIEKMDPTPNETKTEEIEATKDDFKVEDAKETKEDSKFEFSDISWFKTRMDEITSEKKDN